MEVKKISAHLPAGDSRELYKGLRDRKREKKGSLWEKDFVSGGRQKTVLPEKERRDRKIQNVTIR